MLVSIRAAVAMAAALAGLWPAAGAWAQSATGTASVRIVQALSVAKTSDLDFGRIVTGGSAGTVTIAADGSRACGGGLQCLGAVSAGGFTITGAAGETVAVAIDSPNIQLSNGTDTMAVALQPSVQSLVLAEGKGQLRIAGILSVGANQPPGVYSGQYSVSVNYQ